MEKYSEKIKWSYIYTIAFVLVAHGYRLFNNIYVHDSLSTMFQDDIYHERELGRFMHTFTIVFRGAVTNPWLIAVLFMAFMGASVFLVLDILDLSGHVNYILVSGIFVCNPIIINTFSSFLPWVDAYACSLFLVLLGIKLFSVRKPVFFALGCFMIAFSMGFYQAYVCVAIGLAMILFVKECYTSGKKKSLIYFAGIFLGALLFFVMYKMSILIHHVEETGVYNDMSDMWNFESVSLWAILKTTYGNFFSFFFKPQVFKSTYLSGLDVGHAFSGFLAVLNILAFVAIAISLICINVKKRQGLVNILLQIAAFFAFPLGCNFVCVLSKGMEHVLMEYAFLFSYVWLLVLIDELKTTSVCVCVKKTTYWLAVGVCATIIWNNYIFANQLYTRLSMQNDSFMETMSRIIYDIERTEGYEAGITPVCFVGNLEAGNYLTVSEYYADITMAGVGKTPVTYGRLWDKYIRNVMNVNMNVVYVEPDAEMLAGMSVIPSQGYIVNTDGILFVKLSE